MENDLDNDEFELFLKQKADQHKLYPSDKAWKGIYSSLHPGMKWFKVGGSLLILSTLFFIAQQTSFLSPSTSSSDKKAFKNSSLLQSGSGKQQIASSNNSLETPANSNSESNNKNATAQLGTKVSNELISWYNLSNLNKSAAVNNPSKGSVDENITPGSVNSVEPGHQQLASNLYSNKSFSSVDNQSGLGALTDQSNALASGKPVKLYLLNNQLKGFALHNNPEYWQHSPILVRIPSNHLAANSQNKQAQPTDAEETRVLKTSVVKATALDGQSEISIKQINWLEEMALIKLTHHKKNPFNIQFYFSPTVSYRRLADNQNSSHTGLLSPPLTRDLNINNYVNHSPALGAEVGSNILYSVSRNLTLKTGLQLNYTRYNIKAYKYFYEKASIALNSPGSIPDTLSSYTSVRNFGGYAPEELQNQYLQLSVPIGAELKVAGNRRLQFSVAGSIQPTFLLFSNTYLLSTDYLNYTKEPSLVRKWNMNSSVEAFLSYKTGGLRWQVGPQFRYQLMSSFDNRYPIKEYLFDYGIKIGVSKTIR